MANKHHRMMRKQADETDTEVLNLYICLPGKITVTKYMSLHVSIFFSEFCGIYYALFFFLNCMQPV